MSSRFSQLLGLLVVSCIAATARADSTVTLYAVDDPSGVPLSNEISFSALGVGANGATTYLEEAHESLYIGISQDGSTTKTFTGTDSVTHTVQATLVEDASAYNFTASPISTTELFQEYSEACSFDPKLEGGGACVVKERVSRDGTTGLSGELVTYTSSFAGSAVAFYTLTVASGPTQTASSTGQSGFPSQTGSSNSAGAHIELNGAMLKMMAVAQILVAFVMI